MGFLGRRNGFICLFIYLIIIFETGSCSEAQAGLGLTSSPCLSLPNVGITGMSQYAQPLVFFFYAMDAKSCQAKKPALSSLCSVPLPYQQPHTVSSILKAQ